MFKLCFLVLAAVALTRAKPNDPRIINGSPAEQGQFPFIVSLQETLIHTHFCGAAIINGFYLVTAAHCIRGRRPVTISAYVGSVYLDEGGTYYQAESFSVHPNFTANDYGLYNDVAVVKLKDPIQFSENVQPIFLPVNITVNPGDTATTAGWGVISLPDAESPNQLQYLTRPIIDLDECSKAVNLTIPQEQICFGSDEGHGPCAGDSGGPLLYTVSGKNYLIGSVSYGISCAIGYPDMYMRISSYLDWIEEQQKALG